MSGKSKKWYLVVSIRVFGVDLNWTDGASSVENGSLKSMVIAKASQIEDYVKSVGLLERFQVRDRFDQNGAAIEVFTWSQCEDLFQFENKLELIGKEFHRRYISHLNALKERFDPENVGQHQESTPSKNDYMAEEALMKFKSCSPGTKLEIDFFGSGKEVVETTKITPITSRIIEDKDEEVTGEIRQFDDVDQKVTLCNLQDLSGFITLEVNDLSERKALLLAQIEYRPVTVKFAPYRNPVRPDKQARDGRLTDIVSIGRSNEKML